MRLQILKKKLDHPRYCFIKSIYNTLFPVRGKNNVVVRNSRYCKLKLKIVGNNNLIYLGKGSMTNKMPLTVIGSNNYIEIGDNVKIYCNGRGGNICCDGDNHKIIIGKNTTIQSAHINAQEDGTNIIIGEDCMFSANIIVRTSDSHPIYDALTGERVNPAKSVVIGNHVWVAACATIMKGVRIGNGAIVGAGSIVTRDISEATIVAGVPAKEKRGNVTWNKSFQ